MPVGGPAFSSVRKARAALKERAHELITLYIDGMKKALDAGDYETFQKGMAHIVARIPEEEGERIFDIDVDKISQDTKHVGPGIQIGVMIGGLGTAAALPEAQVIDVTAKTIPEPDTSTDG